MVSKFKVALTLAGNRFYHVRKYFLEKREKVSYELVLPIYGQNPLNVQHQTLLEEVGVCLHAVDQLSFVHACHSALVQPTFQNVCCDRVENCFDLVFCLSLQLEGVGLRLFACAFHGFIDRLFGDWCFVICFVPSIGALTARH